MSNAIQLHQGQELAREPGLQFTEQQEEMIRANFSTGATKSEFEVLMAIAKARKLNPLLKQVYFVKRKDKKLNKEVWSVQVSIDGLRAIAERTGTYDGQDEPEFEYVTTKEGERLITLARVKVYKKGVSRPFVGVARWDEYVQQYDGRPTKFWADMPFTMLAKCAEALAIRKAFPEDSGGLYVAEELMQGEHARQLPIEQHPPRISPHGDPGDASDPDDSTEYERLLALLDGIASELGKCDSHSAATALRVRLGSKAAPAEAALTRDLQRAKEQNLVGFEQRKELGAKWQSLDRSVSQLVEFERLRAEVAGIEADLSECTSRSKAAELRERLDSCLVEVREAHTQRLMKRPQVELLDGAMTDLNRQLCKVEAKYGDDPEAFDRA
jgi:phage recombination protein Bet